MDHKMFVKKLIVVMAGATIYALAMNLFLIPGKIYASGFAGVAQLLYSIGKEYFDITLSTGLLLLLFNIPIVFVAWKKIGKSFTFFSFMSVATMTLALEIIPIVNVSPDVLINAIFGGIIGAIGVGITLKVGASTGGMDVIALIISMAKDKSIGTYIFIFNAGIIICAGLLYGWSQSLYTIISLYASSRVIDAIHTRHVKVTVFIVTTKPEEIASEIYSTIGRGITALPATGAYTKENKNMLMIVLTRYELFELRQIIKKIDDRAFVNVVQSEEILGNFRKSYI
ncbi:MAG: putative rane protein [Bacillales bacterium]|jgi:uncharacterized membrane-anchored protein YitT (DUF2179 family)|nr:putative rane protein [Bacillales bacterium]